MGLGKWMPPLPPPLLLSLSLLAIVEFVHLLSEVCLIVLKGAGMHIHFAGMLGTMDYARGVRAQKNKYSKCCDYLASQGLKIAG